MLANTPKQFALRSTCVVAPNQTGPATVMVDSGGISNVEAHDFACDCAVIDVGDHVVMPGLVDSHVHINDPGRTEWESFPTATRAALSGGVTTLVDMPLNCLPVTTTYDAMISKVLAGENRVYCDVGFWAGVVPGNAGQLELLLTNGALGGKAFLVDSGIPEFLPSDRATLLDAMEILAFHNKPLLAHCELASPFEVVGDPRVYDTFLNSRPPSWELDAIHMLVELSRETDCWVHVVHLATAEALNYLKAAQSDGVRVTVETCVHYLTIHAEDIPDGRTDFKCCPPIRSGENNARLWGALKDNILTMVTTDHSPSEAALKLLGTGDFMKAWGGIASLGLALPLMWTEGQAHGVTFGDLARWMSAETAKLAGLSSTRGTIEVGKRADFVVWDPDASFDVRSDALHFLNKLTPFDGRTLNGVVMATFLAGVLAYENGEFASPSGKILV